MHLILLSGLLSLHFFYEHEQHELNPDLEAIYNWCVREREIQTVKERERGRWRRGTEDAHSACSSHGPHMLLEQRVCERLNCEVAGGNLTRVFTC